MQAVTYMSVMAYEYGVAGGRASMRQEEFGWPIPRRSRRVGYFSSVFRVT